MLRILLIVGLLCPVAGFASKKSPVKIFHEVIQSAEIQSLEIKSGVIQKSNKYQYVFVGGFLNEISYGYFKDNAEYLIKLGVSEKSVHRVFPSSQIAVEKNMRWLAQKLLNIFMKNKKPLVITAHSKGAAETLAVLLKYPRLLDHIHKVFLVQSAVNGSYVADHMMNVGKPVDDKIPWYRRFEISLKKSANVTMPFIVNEGIFSLSHGSMKYLWSRLTSKITEKQRQRLQDKVYFIGSHQEKGMSAAIGSSNLYLSTYYGKSDGLIMADEYYLDDLGTNLGLLENVDHMDLFLGFPYSNGARVLRQKFTLALLKLSHTL